MKEVKPTKSKKQKTILPPQKSANDTSNWENRVVIATSRDKTRTKRIVRQVDFMKETELELITIDQARKDLKEQGLTKKQIQQRLNQKSDPKKSSE